MQPHRDGVGAEGLDVALGSCTVRLSRLGPPAFLMAPTTSAAVTEPNSLPLSAGGLDRQLDGAETLESGLQLVGVLEAANGLDLAGPADRRRPGARRPGWRRWPGRAAADSCGRSRP